MSKGAIGAMFQLPVTSRLAAIADGAVGRDGQARVRPGIAVLLGEGGGRL